MSAQRRATLHTLGCRLNQSETKLLHDQAEARGYEVVPYGQPADLAIFNTCTVTSQADMKCRYEIRKFLRENPHAYCAVIGCYSQMGYRELSSIKGVDLILGNHDKMNVFTYIADAVKSPTPVIVRERIDRSDFSIHTVGERPFPWRANLKVQDGCDFMCSFCIIPFARGRARSRHLPNLLDEARSLTARGVREIVLTGVNIGTFTSGGADIVSLCDEIAALPGLSRIRISSIEPTTIPDDILDRMADADHPLLPYLHIPIQHGSDRILHEMNRRYCVSEFLDFIHRAHESVPGLCIGTDILVGFPGETDADFAETVRIFTENPFAYTHVFTYSERDGTPAARRDDHIPSGVRQQRSAELRTRSARQRNAWYRSQLGSVHEVLFEDPREGHWPGYTANYIRVVCDDPLPLRNRRAQVRLDRLAADYVEGTVLDVLDPAQQ